MTLLLKTTRIWWCYCISGESWSVHFIHCSYRLRYPVFNKSISSYSVTYFI